MAWAYYNEIDPKAAAWLRELMRAGVIAGGEVDERSIVDIRGSDLAGFDQCHFFAGIGVWSYALRLAGWPDTRPVWTGSCPCQPFSEAGKGLGFADERHLWPAWFHLIEERSPVVVFGEQSASKGALLWLDLVQTDLEARGYAFGKIVVPAAGLGAPHGRHRTWFVADRGAVAEPNNAKRGSDAARGHQRDGDDAGRAEGAGNAQGRSGARSVAYANGRDASSEGLQRGREHGQQPQDGGASGAVGHAEGRGCGERRDEAQPRRGGHTDGADQLGVALGDTKRTRLEGHGWHGDDRDEPGRLGTDQTRSASAPGPTNGHWRAADWLPCTDGKARPVEPGTFPLAHGTPERVGRLRGYGNAIVAQVAAEIIRAYEESLR